MARVHVDSWRTTYPGIVSDSHLAKLSYDERERVWSRVIPDPGQFTFVAEKGGNVIGFANGGRNRGNAPAYSGELYSAYLLEAHQRQGVGRRLMIAVARELEKEGMGSMIVWVLRANPACVFYEKMAGKIAGSKPIVLGGTSYEEISYGWTDIRALLNLA